MEQIGRFKLREELGTGPYTVTYSASDGQQRCVVKVLKDEAVPDEPEEREGLVRALAGLKSIEHPSAVRLYEGGEQDGRLYVAMERMDCPTLEEKLRQQGRLSEEQAVLYIRQSAQALDKARDMGYCHGDLKPQNVFVVSEEKVKLSDFAIKAFIEDPPEVTQFEPVEEGEEVVEDEWVTAEDLLRTKGKRASTMKLEEDFVGLAVLMLRMLGVEVREQGEDESLEDYREDLMRVAYPRLTTAEAGVSVHAAEVVRRLLTEGGFTSPGEVVVELASAMLLGRTFTRVTPTAPTEPIPAAETESEPVSGSETAQVRAVLDEELMLAEQEGAVAAAEPEPVGEPTSVASGLVASPAVSPFFIWKDRRSGSFFVIHDGQSLNIGRDPDVSDVILMDPAVSRKHCAMSKEGLSIRVEDLGSSNGTFVNGQRVESAELRPGDRLRLGTTRIYTFLPGQEE